MQEITSLFDRLSPGAHLFAIVSEPLRYARIACAIEDAGFEIRDCIMYLYQGSLSEVTRVTGKSDNQGNIDYIPIVVARKPLDGTVCQNVIEYGCGALNIDGCRIGTEKMISREQKPRQYGDGSGWRSHERGGFIGCPASTHTGRWPANIMHDGSEIVVNAFPQTKTGNITPSFALSPSGFLAGIANRVNPHTGDSGSASRYFHCAPTMENVIEYLRTMIGE